MTTVSANIGFKEKPLWIHFLTLAYAAYPVAAQHYGHFVSPVFYLQETFCSLTAAIAIHLVTRFGLVYFWGLTFYLIAQRSFQNMLLPDAGWFENVSIGFWLIAMFVVTATKVRLPYLYPRFRWWLQEPRVKHTTCATLYFKGIKFPLILLDCSSGGAFVKLDERLFISKRNRTPVDRLLSISHPFMNAEEKIIALKSLTRYPVVGDEIRIVINTDPTARGAEDGDYYETDGQVVWTTKITDPFRFGLGLKFTGQSWQDKHKIRTYLKRISFRKQNGV